MLTVPGGGSCPPGSPPEALSYPRTVAVSAALPQRAQAMVPLPLSPSPGGSDGQTSVCGQGPADPPSSPFFLRIQISCGFVCGTQCEDEGSGQGKSRCPWRPPSGPHAIGGRAREPQAKSLEDLLVTGSEAPSPRPPSRGGQWDGQGTPSRPDTRPWGLSSPQASLSGSCPRGPQLPCQEAGEVRGCGEPALGFVQMSGK